MVPYHTTRQVELAAGLVVQELGLVEALEELVKDQQAAMTGGSLQLLCKTSEDMVDEAAVLGEIFDTPDLPTVEEEEVTEDMFHKAALLVVGVAGMVDRATTALWESLIGSCVLKKKIVPKCLKFSGNVLGY